MRETLVGSSKRLKIIIGVIFCLLLTVGAGIFLKMNAGLGSRIQVDNLKVCHLQNPLGIDETAPTFSWQMKGQERGITQTAYRVLVAENMEALQKEELVWDSGKVEAGISVGISYEGTALLAKHRYFWTVQVWNEEDKMYRAAEEAWFETGLLGTGMPEAKWISAPEKVQEQGRAKETEYTISYMLEVENTFAGFAFGADDGRYGSMYIAQIGNTEDKTIFELKRMENNAFVSVEELDLSSCKAEDGKSYAVRLQIQERNLTVEVNGTEVGSLEIEPTEIGSIGYYKDRGTTYAWLDDIYVNDRQGNILFQEDFSQQDTIFDPYYVAIENQRLKIGSGMVLTKGTEHPAPIFRREFQVQDKEVKSARIYMTALGSFQILLNGQQVTDHYLDPGKFAYNKELTYVTYDVTNQLVSGQENAIGITLLHGWYDRAVGYTQIWNPWGDTNALMGMLEITYQDGSLEIIGTDESFQCYLNGPVREDDIYQGEFYDASSEVKGYAEAGLEDSEWESVDTNQIMEEYLTLPLQAKENEPIRCVDTITAISVTEPEENVFVYDFGQNFAGTCKLRMKGKKGQILTLRYGEEINRDGMSNSDNTTGTVWTENLLTAEATDYYVFGEDNQEITFEPQFVYHGFRYLEISGLEEAIPCEAVQGIVLSSDLEDTGSFECSNELLNQYVRNTYWSQRSNFMDNPTDCPQRDERHGWTGDAQIFSLTASYNMNTYSFYRKFLNEERSLQSEGGSFADMVPRNFGTGWGGGGGAESNNCWGDAPVIITWNLYCQYGDRRIIEENYDSLCRWVEMLISTSDNYIRYWGGYGDHFAQETTPNELSDTAWCARSAQLLSKMAVIMGKEEDAAHYQEVYDSFRNAWQSAFVLPDGQVNSYTQTGYALGLSFSLFPEELQQAAAENFNRIVKESGSHVKTGFSGIAYLLSALSEAGYGDTAYEVLLQEEFPSLLLPAKHGATTDWEQLQAYREDENGYILDGSLNHFAFGSPVAWVYTDILGIQSDEENPGYKHFFLEPLTGGGLSYAQGSYSSMYGDICVSWRTTESGYHYEFEIPANTTATLKLPALRTVELDENGKEIGEAQGTLQTGTAGEYLELQLVSGKYIYEQTS